MDGGGEQVKEGSGRIPGGDYPQEYNIENIENIA
jgi:hypothetical protein